MLHAGTFQSMDKEMCNGLSSASRAQGERKIPLESCGRSTEAGSTEGRSRGQEVRGDCDRKWRHLSCGVHDTWLQRTKKGNIWYHILSTFCTVGTVLYPLNVLFLLISRYLFPREDAYGKTHSPFLSISAFSSISHILFFIQDIYSFI